MRDPSLSEIVAVAANAGLPSHKTSLKRRLQSLGVQLVEGRTCRGQVGLVAKAATLPAFLQEALGQADSGSEAGVPVPFDVYMRAAPSLRAEADRCQDMAYAVKRRIEAGIEKMSAYATVAEEFDVSVTTVRRVWKAVRSAPEADWLPILVKGHRGRKPDPIAPEILNYFFWDYGRVEQPQLQAVWERTERYAARHGLGSVPSAKTLQRRWDRLPKATRTLWRDGEKALAKLFPHAERDRSGMKPLDGINVDGREWDIMVELPDGRRARPTVVMVQDEATNYMLGWIVGETESGDMYRRVLCDVFTKFGIPTRALFDNTRAAANKALTAGAKGRNRFKDKPNDIEGLLPRIGCRPDFAQPYNGQSKLVERGFGEIKERSEKDPRLAGAYTGRSPAEKPANYGSRAVPLELFKAVLVEAVEHYNTRTDRRSKIAYKTSHRMVFETGLAAKKVERLTEAQRRYFFLNFERRTLTPDGSVKLGKEPHVNRYWSAALLEHAGKSVIVGFDPDDLASPVLVETMDGTLIDDAVTIIERRGFNSAADAREHGRSKRAYVKREKQNAAELRRMAELEAAGYELPQPDTSAAPSAPVLAPNFKKKPASRRPQGGSVDTDALDRAIARIEQAARYG